MPTDVLLLVVTALLAVVAVGAAVVAVRAARSGPTERLLPTARSGPTASSALVPFDPDIRVDVVPVRPQSLVAREIEGRVVVPPTRQQVVNTALSRPQVRLGILVHGLSHALRMESRDRILALMRREYRRRRRERLTAGRRAVRAAHPQTPGDWRVEPWIAEIESGHRPMSSTTRIEQ